MEINVFLHWIDSRWPDRKKNPLSNLNSKTSAGVTFLANIIISGPALFGIPGPFVFIPEKEKQQSGTLRPNYTKLASILIWIPWTMELLCHTIRTKLLCSYASRDGEHPNTILNGCVCHNVTRVCLSGGCYTKTCPEPFHIATVDHGNFLYNKCDLVHYCGVSWPSG